MRSGRKFAVNNGQRHIRAWGVSVIQDRRAPPLPAVESFMKKFVQIYESHGGVFDVHPEHGKRPWIGPGNLADGGELSKSSFNSVHIPN